jgi:hypothetical protein
VEESRLVDASLDSKAGGRPNFVTTQWGLVAAASVEGTVKARAALEVDEDLRYLRAALRG